MIINEAMARLYFPNQVPVGKRIARGPGNPWMEVIGIAADVKVEGLTALPVPQMDLPGLQHPIGGYAKLLVRSSADTANLTSVLRSEVQQIDPNVSITRVSTLSGDLLNSIAPVRMATTLTNLFGLTALLLAAIGLYGVMAFAVSQGTREIGVRVAFGARNSDVLRMVLSQGMRLALAGVAAGLLAAVALTRLITRFLYGVSATDPLTFASIALLLTAVAALACWMPARRAIRIDPMVALRYE